MLLRTFSVVAILSGTAQARAQWTITGVTDKTIYNDSVNLTVTSQAGYDTQALLNDRPIPSDVPVTVASPDFYQLQAVATNQTSGDVTNLVVRFIVADSSRGGTEVGLPPHTPSAVIPSTPGAAAGAVLRLLMPSDFPSGYEIPVVAWVGGDNGHAVRINGSLLAPGLPGIPVRRGVGAGFLSALPVGGLVMYSPELAGLRATNMTVIETNTVWMSAGGVILADTTWGNQARVAITNGLTISADTTLTIQAGAVVRIDPGIDITNNGRILIEGSESEPVVFMPRSRAEPWGGFIMRSGTGEIAATGAIFTGSGADPQWFGANGNPASHHDEQALFYLENPHDITLSNSAAIYLAGQLGHTVGGGRFTLTRFLAQHYVTGGEYNDATFNVNDSAFIECPDNSAGFVDDDNDALYLVSGTFAFTNTLFGWTKDDAIDCGGSGAGTLYFDSCWFESVFHEGNALSGSKQVWVKDSVYLNCGQGLEDGYGGSDAIVSHALFLDCESGVRLGDNYQQSYTGTVTVTNSILLNNHRDVFGYNWNSGGGWTNAGGQMSIHENLLTSPDTNFPDNMVWMPDADASRLAGFMSTPPAADVGIGLDIRGARFPIDEMTNGIGVRLSTFTTNKVSVDYTVESPDQMLAAGSLEFAPGETRKLIPIPIAPSQPDALVRVSLSARRGAEITGFRSAFFIGDPTAGLDRLQVIRFGQEWTLFWADAAAQLEESGSVTGPWTPVAGAQPDTLDLSNGQRFYRLRR